jgi:hypothetical protein
MRLGVALVAVVSLAGCDCGEDTTVPFHRGGEPARPTPQTAQALVPLEAAQHPDGTREASSAEGSVRVDDGVIRASARFDFDRDGDRDALLVVLGAAGAAVRVLFVEQGREGAGAPVAIASRTTLSVEGGPACVPDAASMAALSDSVVLVSVDARCEDPERPRMTSRWVLAGDQRPRALEIFDFVGRGEGEGLTLTAADRDDDGHDDLEIAVRIVGGGEPTEATLTWMSRAAGLAREGDAPEPTLAALATQAREALRRTPDRALATAERAIALREALCREGTLPRLWVGGARGVPCAASPSMGRAYAVRAAALARRMPAGQPLDRVPVEAALDAFVALDHLGVSIRDADRVLVRDAWLRLATVRAADLVVHRGPALVPAGSRRAPRLSTLAFVAEDRVLVRGDEPRFVTLGEGEPTVEPAPAELGDARILDADRALELVAIERRCEGTVLVLAPAGGLVDPGTGARREVLAAPRAAPAGARCPAMPEGLATDDDGFAALGWAPQGVVLARGARVVVVPLDATGAAMGAPSALLDEVPAPAPLPAGAATVDADAFALAMPFGVVVVDRAARAVRLYRGEDAAPEGLPIDVALAPSGARAAWICGGRLCWAELPRGGGA